MTRTRQRIVTGIDDQGRSTIVSAGPVPTVADFGGYRTEEQWIIEAMPPALDEDQNIVDRREYALQPPPGGAVFRVFTFQGGAGPMHITETLDFIVILSGEVYLVMEEGEVLVQAGDTVIQRGTNHAWDNRSGEECLLAGILISSLPTE